MTLVTPNKGRNAKDTTMTERADEPQTNLEGIGRDPTQTCQLHVIQSQQSANVAGRDLRHVGAETEARKNQTADGRPDGSRGKRDRKREKRISTFAGAMEHWAFFGELFDPRFARPVVGVARTRRLSAADRGIPLAAR